MVAGDIKGKSAYFEYRDWLAHPFVPGIKYMVRRFGVKMF